jgi:hypothetical protein
MTFDKLVWGKLQELRPTTTIQDVFKACGVLQYLVDLFAREGCKQPYDFDDENLIPVLATISATCQQIAEDLSSLEVQKSYDEQDQKVRGDKLANFLKLIRNKIVVSQSVPGTQLPQLDKLVRFAWEDIQAISDILAKYE